MYVCVYVKSTRVCSLSVRYVCMCVCEIHPRVLIICKICMCMCACMCMHDEIHHVCSLSVRNVYMYVCMCVCVHIRMCIFPSHDEIYPCMSLSVIYVCICVHVSPCHMTRSMRECRKYETCVVYMHVCT